MKIYDEITKEEITREIDSSKGYTYNGKVVSGHVDETKVIMEGSVNEFWPNGMKRIIPGYDVYEECKFYHAYTEEELKVIQDEKDKLAKEEADRLDAEKAAEEAAKLQAEKEKAWNTGLDKINEIDAQITYTAMMTNTLLNDESDASDNDSSMENKTETDNTSTKEDTNNEQSNG